MLFSHHINGRMDPLNVAVWVIVDVISYHRSGDIGKDSMVDWKSNVSIISSRKVIDLQIAGRCPYLGWLR
jgi:hypothetical protein